jgi:hypothetical protein
VTGFIWPRADYCEDGNEHSNSVKGGKFSDELINYICGMALVGLVVVILMPWKINFMIIYFLCENMLSLNYYLIMSLKFFGQKILHITFLFVCLFLVK